MKSWAIVVASFLLVFSSGLLPAESPHGNLILKENFDSGKIPQNFFGNLKLSADTRAKCGKALAAEGSPKNWSYPRALRIRLDNIKPGDAVSAVFEAASTDGFVPGNQNFALILGIRDGKEVRFAETVFPRDKSARKIKVSGCISEDCDVYYLDITGKGPFSINIDNIEIEKFAIPLKARWIFSKDAIAGLRFQPTDGYFLDFSQPFLYMSKEEFFPFVDRFGQFKHKSWKNKILSEADFKKRIEEEKSFNKSLGKIANRDEYGGLVSPKHRYEATGYFRTQKVGGSWFMVDPLGNLFWSFGIDCVGMETWTGITGREHFFEDISDARYIIKNIAYGKFFYENRKFDGYNFSGSNIDKKYGVGTRNSYGDIASKRMKIWGLNTYGAWSDERILRSGKTPYTVIANSHKAAVLDAKLKLYGYWQPLRDFFSEDFKTETMRILEAKRHLINSPWCIGVFVDNELPWQNARLKTAKAVLTCPAGQPAKAAFRKMLEDKYGNVEKLNAAWASSYKSWDAFLSERDFIPEGKSAEADLEAFERAFYDRYFEVCRLAVKNVNPYIMYFGCRLAWSNDAVAISASKYCDVVSYNLYRENVADFDLPEGAQDKPVIIGEFHFGDASGGVFGGGLVPRKTAEEKADSFSKYALSAMTNPRIAGAHWFQWFDQCTSGRFDGENYSIGFVDIADTPHYQMALSARKLSEKMYEARLATAGKHKKTDNIKIVQ